MVFGWSNAFVLRVKSYQLSVIGYQGLKGNAWGVARSA
jgi:hypothetical protein